MKKKSLVIILIILVALLAGIIAVGVSCYSRLMETSKLGWDDGIELQSGPWIVHTNDAQDKCFLTGWQWDGNPENMEVVIPDEIDGVQVVALGGFDVGMNYVFDIVMPEEMLIDNPADKAWVTEVDAIAADYPQDYPVYQFNVKLNDIITNTGDCESNLYVSTMYGDAIAYKIEMIFE